MKKCIYCQSEKAESDFPKNRRYKSGLNARCKNCINKQNKAYRDENPVTFSEMRKRHYQKNITNMRAQKASYVAKHKTEKSAYDVVYRKENADCIRQYKREWEKGRRDSPEFKIKRNLRRRIHHVLKGSAKAEPTFQLIGCSVQAFIVHIESQFEEGMSWDNYSPKGWHIDHIIPCSAFDLIDVDQQKKCFHYSNQRPLWATENLKKGRKIHIELSSDIL